MRYLYIALLLTCYLGAVTAEACTVFSSRGDEYAYVAKSYDWETQVGLVIANMRGINKESLNFSPNCKDIEVNGRLKTLNTKSWQSLYGSVTFNQFGRGLPTAGMNEHGLVVETAEMDPSSNNSKSSATTCYAPDNAEDSINSMNWTQYVLDMFSTVAEVKEDLQKKEPYAIVPYLVPIHYMVCDLIECAIIEIGPDGNLRVYPDDPGYKPTEQPSITLDDGRSVSPYALTNDYYDCSVQQLENYTGFGGETVIPTTPFCQDYPERGNCDKCRLPITDKYRAWSNSNSIERFVRAVNITTYEQDMGDQLNVDRIFDQLNEVIDVKASLETGGTKWQIVYDIAGTEIHWRTNYDGQNSDDQHFNGDYRSLRVDSSTFKSCDEKTYMDPDVEDNDPTLVVNIDDAQPVIPGNGPSPCWGISCWNPNPLLEGEGPLQPYEYNYNRYLVEDAAEKSLPTFLDTFIHFVQDLIPDADNNTAEIIMYNIWGGYPLGYTACNREVTQDDKINLFLDSALNPYINPYIKDIIDDGFSYSQKKHHKCTNAGCAGLKTLYNVEKIPLPLCNSVEYRVISTEGSGISSTNFLQFRIEDGFTFEGYIGKLKASDISVHLYCHHDAGWGQSEGTYYMGAVNLVLEFDITDFNGTADGLEIGNDSSNLFCFNKDETDVTKLKLDPFYIKDESCKFTGFLDDNLPKDDRKSLCEFTANIAKTQISDIAADKIKSNLKSTLKSSFGCQDNPTLIRNPLQLSVDWGIPDTQSVQAYAGRSYLLEAIVNADQDSYSAEYVVITEGLLAEENSTVIAADKIRTDEGSNFFIALWQPQNLGDTTLYIDAMRREEDGDEVVPVPLNVTVLHTEDDPDPGQEIIPLVKSQGKDGSSSGCFITTLFN